MNYPLQPSIRDNPSRKTLLVNCHIQSKMTTKRIGQIKEQQACAFLQKKGLQLVQANYHCHWGEIDLIMEDRSCTVFVEVRFRKTQDYGSAEATVSSRKQKKLIMAAQCYLSDKSHFDDIECRFDVVGISGSEGKEQMIWIKNAFGVDQIHD